MRFAGVGVEQHRNAGLGHLSKCCLPGQCALSAVQAGALKLICLLLCLAVSGASHAAPDKDKTGSRVLATVNGVEITQAEVDLVYERTGVADATAQAADARKRLILC